MTATQTTPDFASLKTRARKMSDAALQYSADDASDAANMAEDLEKAGCRVQKSGGYYRDEASVYRTELRRREAKR
jgi:hypothetical protein